MQATKYSLNNFRCLLGQKKNGVQLGGDVILRHILPAQPNRAIQVNQVDIYRHADYKNGYKLIQRNLRYGRFNINLGGDHSIAAATIQPMLDYYREDLLVVWIDAHADLNTYQASLTKNIHGMPVGALTGLMEHWYRIRKNRTLLDMQNLIYVGIRDLDKFEQETIIKNRIMNFPTYTNDVIQAIQQHPAKYIHISCDIDSMDPSIMPSTGTKVLNGLKLKNVINIIQTTKPRLVGFDLVEFNPLIGNKRQVRKTLLNIQTILCEVMV